MQDQLCRCNEAGLCPVHDYVSQSADIQLAYYHRQAERSANNREQVRAGRRARQLSGRQAVPVRTRNNGAFRTAHPASRGRP